MRDEKPPFPFIMIPIIDILLLIMSAFLAYLNRGDFLGWVATGFVFWQTWILVKFVREHP
jgi:hypothetical protein